LFGEIALVDDAGCTSRVARLARMRVKAQAIDLEYGRWIRQRRRAPVAVAIPANGREGLARIGGQHPHLGRAALMPPALQAKSDAELLATKSSIREVLKMQICQEILTVLLSYREILFGDHE
jgi:hypothetical protein